MSMSCGVVVGAALALLVCLLLKRDPPPLFGVYSRPGKWYYFKYLLFSCIYYFRKYAHRRGAAEAGAGAGAGARAGQGVRALADPARMDRAQPLGDHAKAFDAVFFIAAGEGEAAGAGAPQGEGEAAGAGAGAPPGGGAGEGVYVMMGCERRPLGMCNGLFYIGLPGLGLLCSRKLPDTVLFGAASGEFGAEGIHLAPLEPMRRWTLTYQGPMWLKSDPSKVLEVSFSGEWTADSDHFDFDCDLHPPAVIRSIAREPWTRQYFDGLKTAHQSHYEQFGVLRGSVSVAGEPRPRRLQLPSFRDHSFGARRDWSLMHRYAFHHIFLADGLRISVGVICQPSTATTFEVGVVALPDGRVVPVQWVDMPLWRYGEGGTAPLDYGFSFHAGGQDYYVQVLVEHSSTHYVSAEWEARMAERFCKYEVNGVRGRGTCEFHYRHHGGRPDDAAANDPEWYRKMCHRV